VISTTDRQMMARALRLAARGMTTTTPNPRVGCVIVAANGDIIGEGFHQSAGLAHAEINALAACGDADDKCHGATVYVTLEPCSHQGRTGPCCDALINAGIARLVYAMEDPNPLVAGEGLARLEAADIDVDGPVMEEEARALNPGFIKRMNTGVPLVRCKMAMSVDGRTAMASGESKWISGPDARQDVQHLRARSCAIVTGVDSVLEDDPALTVRLGEGNRQPLRVIVDSRARCPENAEILSQPGRTVIACCDTATPPDNGLTYWRLPAKAGRVDLSALLRKLADEGCNEVLVETGATLAGAFVANGLIDELIVYMAAKLLGSRGRPLFELPIDKMSGQLPLTIRDVRAIGPDWRIEAVPDPDA